MQDYVELEIYRNYSCAKIDVFKYYSYYIGPSAKIVCLKIIRIEKDLL